MEEFQLDLRKIGGTLYSCDLLIIYGNREST